MRYSIPTGFEEWWNAEIKRGPHTLRLAWRCGNTVEVGQIIGERPAALINLSWSDPQGHPGSVEGFVAGSDRIQRALGRAFTRAGWLRPALDPMAFERLLELRDSEKRVEFILDTNAMADGVGHWLTEHFADRADLVVTAVSLRELQDQFEIAQLSKTLTDKADKRGRMLSARQTYLAANRMRESLTSRMVLWRELALDDTALLLSRGAREGKSSESDTMLLRAVRRSILDRVNGLERFFVTADVALARRATTELPTGSVIASRITDVTQDRVYLPCSWWPGNDQGRSVPRSTARLVWELLALADRVDLLGPNGGWSFEAYAEEMWPSDYASPWVFVTPYVPRPVASQTSARRTKPSRPVEPVPNETGGTPQDFIWTPTPSDAGTLGLNLRLSITTLLDALGTIAAAPDQSTVVTLGLGGSDSGGERRRHVIQLLEALDIAVVAADGGSAVLGGNYPKLAAAWRANDLDLLFDLLRVWAPLDEQATRPEAIARPEATLESARALAARLGQGLRQNSTWLPGGRRPSAAKIRDAIAARFAKLPSAGPQALSIHTLLTEVFLGSLGVAPVRAVRAWDRLVAAGVFTGLEFRAGGLSSGRNVQEVAELVPGGWTMAKLDLEAVQGYRDVVRRTAARA